MGAQRKSQESFVLVYGDYNDPSREETAAALDLLKRYDAEEVLPGTIRLVGDRDGVTKSVHALGRWELSDEKHFEMNPPFKSRAW